MVNHEESELIHCWVYLMAFIGKVVGTRREVGSSWRRGSSGMCSWKVHCILAFSLCLCFLPATEGTAFLPACISAMMFLQGSRPKATESRNRGLNPRKRWTQIIHSSFKLLCNFCHRNPWPTIVLSSIVPQSHHSFWKLKVWGNPA